MKRTHHDTAVLDPKLLAKVRGLLAKAESTTFPEEADALTAKAQELMARHAIDAALLDGAGPGDATPGRRTIVIDPPYASAKSSVLGAVAAANRCQVIVAGNDDLAHVFGFDVDLDVTEVLYTSLLLQATAEMTAAGPQVDHLGRSRTRAFRHAFLLAFAGRVGQRLHEASRATVDEVDATSGGTLVPVLAGREEAVASAVRAAFPHARARRLSVSSAEGVRAGHQAGDRADIGRPRMGPDARPQPLTR
jgi:hypothetical protein